MHDQTPIRTAGAPLTSAKAAMIMLHGRGSSADEILSLASELNQPQIAYLAPQAAGHTWYPYRFIEPVERNEPALSSALAKVAVTVNQAAAAGIQHDKIYLLGFSQGACLALEYAARNAQRYGGVFGLSGGLIGDKLDPARYPTSLQNTPVFLGCSDVDFHIPLSRVQESSAMLRQIGGDVTERIYPNMGHTVNKDEILFIQFILAQASQS